MKKEANKWGDKDAIEISGLECAIAGTYGAIRGTITAITWSDDKTPADNTIQSHGCVISIARRNCGGRLRATEITVHVRFSDGMHVYRTRFLADSLTPAIAHVESFTYFFLFEQIASISGIS